MYRLSPSKLEAKEQCPCFDYQQFVVKDDGEETPAERGTRLHKAVEDMDLSLCKDDGERRQVQMCIDYTMNMLAGNEIPPVEVWKEKELRIGLLDNGEYLTSGTLDYAALWANHATLLDYKFVRGASVSEPKDNLQLACYALGLLEACPGIEAVEAGILAPGVEWAPEPVIYMRADMPKIVERIKAVLASAEDPFKQPRSGEVCNNCTHASRCPALGKVAVVVANKIGLPVPEVFAPESIVSPRDRAIAQVLANALEQWADQVKKHNSEAAKNGVVIPGHTLVSRSGKTFIDSVSDAIEILSGTGLCPKEEVYDTCTISFAKLAKKVAEIQQCKEDKAREQLMNTLGPTVRVAPEVRFLQRKRGLDDKKLLGS